MMDEDGTPELIGDDEEPEDPSFPSPRWPRDSGRRPMKPMTKLEEVSKKHGFTVVQRPKGSATIIFGGRKLAAAVRKRAQAE
jgi:hypothetical protein